MPEQPTLTQVTRQMFLRYAEMLSASTKEQDKLPTEGQGDSCCTPEHLLWMCTTALHNLENWPTDKSHRWLGFIQGCLAMQGIISVDSERDFSRPLFHAAYNEQDLKPPERTERE